MSKLQENGDSTVSVSNDELADFYFADGGLQSVAERIRVLAFSIADYYLAAKCLSGMSGGFMDETKRSLTTILIHLTGVQPVTHTSNSKGKGSSRSPDFPWPVSEGRRRGTDKSGAAI
jgi:hypothetical protein